MEYWKYGILKIRKTEIWKMEFSETLLKKLIEKVKDDKKTCLLIDMPVTTDGNISVKEYNKIS